MLQCPNIFSVYLRHSDTKGLNYTQLPAAVLEALLSAADPSCLHETPRDPSKYKPSIGQGIYLCCCPVSICHPHLLLLRTSENKIVICLLGCVHFMFPLSTVFLVAIWFITFRLSVDWSVSLTDEENISPFSSPAHTHSHTRVPTCQKFNTMVLKKSTSTIPHTD